MDEYIEKHKGAERHTLEVMDAFAEMLARDCCEQINRGVTNLPDKPMPYKAQWTLEQLIKKLKERV